MAIVYGANYGAPTLDLNFARNKSLIDTVTGRNLVTFTRAQTAREATYVGADGLIKSAVADEPRFDHNPVTGESLGLLIEEARTNIIVSSSVFNTGGWNQDGVVLTANAGVAPDGTTTATSVSQGTGNNRCFHFDNSGVTGNKVFSFFAKANAGTSFQLTAVGSLTPNATVTVNLSSGTVSGFSGATIQLFASGWYRVFLPVLVTTASGSSTYFSFSGPAASVFLWGFQLEAGSFPTSYIPTTGSTVTRAADVVSMTGTNFSSWYNQNEGTLFAQARLSFSLSTSAVFPTIYQMGDYPDRLWMLYLNGTVNALTVGADTHTRNFATFSSSPQSFKVAQALSNTSLTYGVSKDGTTTLTGSLGKSITGLSGIAIGAGAGATKHIARLTYYPTRLQDYQLQQLTK